MLFLEGRCGEGAAVQEYDLIILGSGSGMNFVDALIQENPKIRIAVIDKDEPGGICLTRGCIPSKIMVYPAELVRTMEDADALGIEADVRGVSYEKIMKRMRLIIDGDIDAIKEGLSSSENIDYFHAVAEFVSPYTLKVEGKTVRGKMIFLGSGSRAIVPPIKGLDKVRYHTSDSIIRMELWKGRRASRSSAGATSRPSSDTSSPRWDPRSQSSGGIPSSCPRRNLRFPPSRNGSSAGISRS